MIEKLPISDRKAKRQARPTEHVTMTPYVVGFVLSLVFTLIPYYLVVHKSFNATTILATIIVFAVLQMAIQLVFFLHLGREKKPHFNSFFLMSTLGIIVFVVVGSIWIMGHLSHNMTGTTVTDKISTDEQVYKVAGGQAGTCPNGIGTTYMVEFKNNTASPSHVNAHLCDAIMFMNLDKSVRDINFGLHDHHEAYAGNNGQALGPNQNMSITLTELGTYLFHDHIQDKITGDFTVTR